MDRWEWVVVITASIIILGGIVWWICFLVGVYPSPPSTCARTPPTFDSTYRSDLTWTWKWSEQVGSRQLASTSLITSGWKLVWNDHELVLDDVTRTWEDTSTMSMPVLWWDVAESDVPMLTEPWLTTALQMNVVEWTWTDESGTKERYANGEHQVWENDLWVTQSLLSSTWVSVPIRADYVHFATWGRTTTQLTWNWSRAWIGDTPSSYVTLE